MNLNKIITYLGFAKSQAEALATKGKFETYTEETLKISERKVGGKVELVNADGELETAPNGVYEMEDGFVFEVVDGLIASIDGEDAPADKVTEMAEADAPADEAPAENKDSEEIKALKEQVDALEQRVKTLEDNAVAVEAVKDEQANMSKAIASMYEAIKVFAKMPTQDSNFAKKPAQKDMKKKFDSELANILKAVPRSKY